MEERRAMSEGEGLGERLLSISLSSAVFTPFAGPPGWLIRGTKGKWTGSCSSPQTPEEGADPHPQQLKAPNSP